MEARRAETAFAGSVHDSPAPLGETLKIEPDMNLYEQIQYAIEDAEAGRFDSALLHACIAIDATARKLFPSEKKVGVRFVNCIRRYYWLIEPMLVGGMNLEETVFSNIVLKTAPSPDFADIIYEVFRCNHAHGDEIPEQFTPLLTIGSFNSTWAFAHGRVQMPDRVVWALLAVAMLSKVNKGGPTDMPHYLSLGVERFPLRDWWGREDDFRSVASRYNQIRVKFDGLERLQQRQPNQAENNFHILTINPPPL